MNRAQALTKATDALVAHVEETRPADLPTRDWALIVIALRLAERAITVEVAR